MNAEEISLVKDVIKSKEELLGTKNGDKKLSVEFRTAVDTVVNLYTNMYDELKRGK